jgi:hypothetical protein
MAVAESNLAQNIRSSAPAKGMKDEGVTGAPTIWFTNKVWPTQQSDRVGQSMSATPGNSDIGAPSRD